MLITGIDDQGLRWIKPGLLHNRSCWLKFNFSCHNKIGMPKNWIGHNKNNIIFQISLCILSLTIANSGPDAKIEFKIEIVEWRMWREGWSSRHLWMWIRLCCSRLFWNFSSDDKSRFYTQVVHNYWLHI